MAKSLLERFEEKVMVDPNSGCWLWTAGLFHGTGYGKFTPGPDGSRLAHRTSYNLFVGPIPDGLHIDHKCRQRCCVNPSHLEPVTCAENIRRGIGGEAEKKRYDARIHCRNGHPSAEFGRTWVKKDGRRSFYCIVCQREWMRAKKAKLNA